MKVTVRTAGLDRLIAKAKRKLDFLSSDGAREVMRKSGAELVTQFQRTINTFTPGPVKDLAPKTKVQKMRQVGRLYPILVRSGDLFRSMVPRVTRKGTQWSITVMYKGRKPNITNARLAQIHITGEGRNPPRDFTSIPKNWRVNLFQRLRRELQRRTNA